MSQRILIRNAVIITMDDGLGDLKRAELLIEGERVAAVGRIGAVDAEMIDGTGFIVIPGVVNAHMHTWQTGLRGIAASWTLLEYFRKMHAGLATVFSPADLHIATLVGALNQ